MPTDLGMKYITRHELGTCRHTRHFYLDPILYIVTYLSKNFFDDTAALDFIFLLYY